MGDHIVYGKEALRLINRQLGSSSRCTHAFGPFTTDFVSAFETIWSGKRLRLDRTLFITHEQTLAVLEAIRQRWEKLFTTSLHLGLPCWLALYGTIKSHGGLAAILSSQLLVPAGQSHTTALFRNHIMARTTPLLLIGIALLDGATMHLSHTHQKDIVLRLIGFRLEITISQWEGTCIAHMERNTTLALAGTYPVEADYTALLEFGQSWRSPNDLFATSDVQQAVRLSGFVGLEETIYTVGFLELQFMTLTTAAHYLRLAMQAYEIAFLGLQGCKHYSSYSDTQTPSELRRPSMLLCGRPGIEQSFLSRNPPSYRRCNGHASFSETNGNMPNEIESNATHITPSSHNEVEQVEEYDGLFDGALWALRELMSAEFFDKMGKPNSRRHEAQLRAFQAQSWVVSLRMLIEDSGGQDPNEQQGESSSISRNDFAHRVLRRNEVSVQTIKAWLACWSLCRIIVHVQILPGFIGSHNIDRPCWLD